MMDEYAQGVAALKYTLRDDLGCKVRVMEADAERLDEIADRLRTRGQGADHTYGKAEGIRIALTYVREFAERLA